MRLFGYVRDPLFLAASAAYVINRVWLRHALPGWFVQGYFNDMLLIPAALPLVLWFQRQLGWRAHDGAPTWLEILGHFVLWSLICEVVVILWLRHGTGDPADVIAYVVGGVAAGFWWKRRRSMAPVASHEL